MSEKRLTLRTTADKVRQLKVIAAYEETNVNAILNGLIDAYLEKKIKESTFKNL